MAQSSFHIESTWPGVLTLEPFPIGASETSEPTESIWPGVQTREAFLIGASEISEPTGASSHTEGPLHQESKPAVGHLEISGLRASIPEQKLRLRLAETGGIIIETDPADHYLRFRIELPAIHQEDGSQVREFQFWPSDKTVEGGVLFTRTAFALMNDGKCLFHIQGISEPMSFNAKPLSELEKSRLLYRAKILRKLQYLQDVFEVRFTLPDLISSEEAKLIEIVFRGITEGEFTTRGADTTLLIDPTCVDSDHPPFSGPGQFDADMGDNVALFGQQLVVGPFTLHLMRAELANPRVLDPSRNNSNEFISVRFEILDNQMRFRFENYAQIAKEDLEKPLEEFRRRLLLDEPQELADLVTGILANDVSSFEAGQIAMGWTFYSNLPDRYCPQEPEIDQSTGHWRVPIWLVYANGEGGHVGDLLIHKKTGVIVSSTSIEELRSKAMALAETLLHAG